MFIFHCISKRTSIFTAENDYIVGHFYIIEMHGYFLQSISGVKPLYVTFSRHNKLLHFFFLSNKHKSSYVQDLDLNPVQLIVYQVFQIIITHTYYRLQMKQTYLTYLQSDAYLMQ